jgi:hypothetical protein
MIAHPKVACYYFFPHPFQIIIHSFSIPSIEHHVASKSDNMLLNKQRMLLDKTSMQQPDLPELKFMYCLAVSEKN